ncbi:MAG: 50S ribosomal protein L11 methyltransferase [Desulfobacterales bacterium]|nr:MAG: 50S ribosomal protein L11 methyltransferase [Desulfobacterales bacterium]
MKFKKITAEFNTEAIELAEEMISHVFFSFNLKGVVCNVPIPEPDEGFGTNTLPLPEQNAIIGYLPEMDASDMIIEKIRAKLSDLSFMGICINVRIDVVDEKDWADAWKDYFNVTRITDRIVVKPEWKPYTPKPADVVIHIDPGMAFGTGTHPTTAMCIECMETHLTSGQTVLDVGCGSGILMIAAAKLGAANIFGIDVDPMAVDITRKNLEKNKIDPSLYALETTTLDTIPNTHYDLIVANIIAQVIVDIAGDIKKRMVPQGVAILSGIIKDRRADVLDAMNANGLVLTTEHLTDEWVAMVVCHK